MEIALKKMRELGCEDPRSWYYQGAIHWVPTKAADIPRLQTENPLCPSYSHFSSQDPDKSPSIKDKLHPSWDNCTHNKNQAGQRSTVHFLPWHRLYVYHFEKIVRKLSGDPNFSLPYWDYISLFDKELPDKNRLTMPAEFRLPGDSSNSLYESAREKGLTAGKPLDKEFSQKNLLNSMETLRDDKVYADFNKHLNSEPHGVMHDYLGGSITEGNDDLFNPIYNRDEYLNLEQGKYDPQYGLMANVPSAGFDPIFWMHHGNIDRLWAQWTNDKRVMVTPKELERVSWPYQFFEPDGKVKAYTMQEVVKSVYNMDYVYDDGSSPNIAEIEKSSPNIPVKPNLTTLMANQLGETVLGSSQPETEVGSDQEFTQTVPLNPQFRNQLDSNQLRSRDPSSQPDYILEVDVTYIGRPRGIYEVYLNLPNDESARNSAIADIDTYFAGTMSFFVLEADRPTTETFEFDITDEILLQKIQNVEEFNTDSFSISIMKEGGPVEETLTVDKLAIYRRN